MKISLWSECFKFIFSGRQVKTAVFFTVHPKGRQHIKKPVGGCVGAAENQKIITTSSGRCL